MISFIKAYMALNCISLDQLITLLFIYIFITSYEVFPAVAERVVTSHTTYLANVISVIS